MNVQPLVSWKLSTSASFCLPSRASVAYCDLFICASSLVLSLRLLVFLLCWGLNPDSSHWATFPALFKHFYFFKFLRQGLTKSLKLLRPCLNLWSSCLSLSECRDYRHVPPWPASLIRKELCLQVFWEKCVLNLDNRFSSERTCCGLNVQKS